MEFLIKRGDIVTCALSGDYGKPRPAVVVQSDLYCKRKTSGGEPEDVVNPESSL